MTKVTDEDLYARLQVPPGASAEEIGAAYRRLSGLYSAERLQDSPADFQELAARRRDEIAAAFAVLGDEQSRAAYDRSRAMESPVEVLDYRPLPPARRAERASPSVSSSVSIAGDAVSSMRSAEAGGRSLWPPLLVGGAVLSVLLLLVLSGVRVQTGTKALQTPVIPNLVLPYTDQQVQDARVRADGSNDPGAWIAYGNRLYDNLQTMREQAPLSPQYRNALPQWLDVAQAYARALELGAGPATRADMAVAQWSYGVGVNDQDRVTRAVGEAEAARAAAPDDPRVLLNYGVIMAGLNPAREPDAIEAWRRLLRVAPRAPEARQAQQLLAPFERSP